MTRTTAFAATTALATAALALSACGSDGGTDAAGAAAGDCTEGSTLRLALNQTEEHPSYLALDGFGQSLEEGTDGRWGIDIFPNETLGAQAEVLSLVGDGTVDMAIVSGTQLESLSEDFVVFNLPQVFTSVDQQMSVVNDPEVVGDLYSSLEESNGMTVVGAFTQGTRSVYTADGPVETPEDLAGLKIRVQESEVANAMVTAMGGSPTPLAYGEVYTALQSGVIDGAENNAVSYVQQRHAEVAPYYSETNHLVGVDYLVINTDQLGTMCDEDRAVFDEGWTSAHEEHTALWQEATDEALATAEENGATVTEVDAEAFAGPLQEMAESYLTTDTQRELYDAARASAR